MAERTTSEKIQFGNLIDVIQRMPDPIVKVGTNLITKFLERSNNSNIIQTYQNPCSWYAADGWVG